MSISDIFRRAAQQAPQYPQASAYNRRPTFQTVSSVPRGATLEEQIANSIDWSMSSGDVWNNLGKDAVYADIASKLRGRGINDLSQVSVADNYGYHPVLTDDVTGGKYVTYGEYGRRDLTPEELATVQSGGDGEQWYGNLGSRSFQYSGVPINSLGDRLRQASGSIGATNEGGFNDGRTSYNFGVGPNGELTIVTGSQSPGVGMQDVAGVLGVVGAGLGMQALGAGTAGAAASSAGSAGGAGAAGAAGAVDLGGGLMMAADGSIVGSTMAGGGALSNAAIEGMIAGSGFGGSGALGAGAGAGVTDLGGGLSIGADGSIVGNTMAGGGTMSNAGIEAMMNGAGLGSAPAGAAPSAGSGGTPPPANPYHPGSYLDPTNLGNLASSGMTGSNALGLASTALGALSGGQGQSAETSSTRSLPAYLQGPVAGDLIPRTQGLLSQQMPLAGQAGQQMVSMGSGLLGQTAPTTATNPYLRGIADDMQRRTSDLLGQNNLAIQGNFVGSGGLGGSRQGVAQGQAASKAADYLQGNVANLYGNAYQGDQNRLRQDWALGSGLMNQGLNTQFSPLQNTANIYSPFSGFGQTTNSTQSGGGIQGALGGALSGASFGRSMGWW